MSAQDIVERIRSLLDEADASHSSEDGGKHVVPLSADDVTIANLPDDADRIKHLGTFSVTISGEGWPEGVVKTVEVVAED